ncbi:ATP-binding SpoIIE family protein phosphatase [Protofrankia symbiont of Coriaria ruscifolia]|uniref:ATP-binding SpoIIE family protein phosphatase n=1 Tax=Protofrankia symbiont of Coriaria ruscifolia TaxID=1306542 RepID=UPI001F5FF0A9|nr:SpoIIE family protein phosphatase [Protofrankia symbiont of Coriaria ruscifolia]
MTEQQRSLHNLYLLYEAARRIGRSLDVDRTAQDLADVLVPALGDIATVDIDDAVRAGDEPSKILGGGQVPLRRVAAVRNSGCWSPGFILAGMLTPPLSDRPEIKNLQHGKVLMAFARAEAIPAAGDFPDMMVPLDAHSGMSAPLYVRGLLFGIVTVWRTGSTPVFDRDDRKLLREIVSRAELSVDNARRYTRERHAAVALQQGLLPRASTDTTAAETAGVYLPADRGCEVGGDWYDVIPLSSLRVAFVVGDVIGHGLSASATMGRLRTAVQALADLDPDPGALLTHLDDLVQRLADEADLSRRDVVGATCVYAVYDPVAGRCTIVSAGHPPPAVVTPEGTVDFVDVSPGPPLGVGGMPFEVTEIDLKPGSMLVLYTDGLLNRHNRDVTRGMEWLHDRLEALCDADRPLDDIGRALLGDTSSTPPADDVVVLLARTRTVAAEAVVDWEFPADPSVVAEVRRLTTRQLAAWNLDDLVFTTELVVSELATNAIRYAQGPIRVRLIRDDLLVCEVADASNTQPRLCYAHATDEGGRGLFLVAQMTRRWGSRYGRLGKTIWTEQPTHTVYR